MLKKLRCKTIFIEMSDLIFMSFLYEGNNFGNQLQS